MEQSVKRICSQYGEKRVALRTAKKDESVHIYEGYDLYFLFQSCKIKGQAKLYCRDGLVTALSEEEVKRAGMAILADSVDGVPLSKEDTYRLILSSDNLGRRWAKGVQRIEFQEDRA